MLTGRTGISPRLVGRAAPLAQLSGLVAAAAQGRSDRAAVALVAGDAGVGKTRLLQELATTVPAGTVVLAGQAEQGALGRPWELVQELLGGELPPALGGDQRRAVVEAIENRINATPSLVVFEDLHWADGESVAVFDRLAATGPPTLVLVGTYRPEELSHRLPGGDLLARLERRQSVRQVRLEPFTRPETAALLAGMAGRPLPARVVAALHARTGGNPFFLEELVVAAGDTDPAALVDQPLPWSLAELVQRQLDGLSPAERRLAEAAAILGRSAEFDLLAGMTGASEEDLIAELRTLVDRGLLVEECEDEFSFHHALVRDAVEGQLLGRERRRLHERALAAMQEACCGDLAELARHARGAGRYAEFVELARRGAEYYLSRGSTHQALHLAAEALTEEADDVVLLAVAARTSWLLGIADEAIGHGERWLRLARASGDIEQEAAALCLLGRAEHDAGRSEEMWKTVAVIEQLVEQMNPGEARARALAFLAQANMLHEKVGPALAYANRAIEEAEACDAKGVRAQAMVERASTLVGVPDQVFEGIEALRAAVPEAEAVGDQVLVTRALNNLAQALPIGSQESAELADRMREIADRAGFDANLSYYAIHEAERALFLADEPRLRAELQRINDLVAFNTQLWPSWPASLEASLLVEHGKVAEANELVEDICARHQDMPEWVIVQVLEMASHLGDRERGERCRQRLLAAPPGGYGAAAYAAANSILEILEAGFRLGWSRADVEPLVTARKPLIGPIDHLQSLVDAVIELWWGQDGADRVAVLLADPRLDDEVSRLTLAALRMSVARAYAAGSRKGEAREQAAIARALLERWPGWRRDETDALLRRLDAVADQDAELTPREQEVAALLAEGLSNAELAKRLYISPKTAAVHVSNILMKLGMANRAEVAAWAVRTGLASDPAGPG